MPRVKTAFDGNFVSLLREMNAAIPFVEAMTHTEATQEVMALLEDIRHAALKLVLVSEATIEEFEGSQKPTKKVV